ncbi:hypothetical protein [Streptomyces iconiensis]|uniref:Secreted protein n=1 Tax=Streptomyces iconiensis TaxID=1384038 RepID=A0ABT7A303_9ACTN|nr:hypothetical protein [Streptomyces iconiensis]MDJ1135700.1 hypothetical protein [Streptomyces iconiensis]
MPLHVPPAPAPALRSVLTALGSPTAVRGTRAPVALRHAQGPLRPELPLPAHEMVSVAPCDPGASRTSPLTRLTGWRFLLRDAGADLAGAEATETDATHAAAAGTEGAATEGASTGAGGVGTHAGSAEAVLTADGWAFGQFRQGPYVLSTVRALRQAQLLPTAYQPRLLSFPELYMLTLWLHRDVTADPASGSPAPSDLLIPLAPAPPGIPAHQPHRVDALLPLLTRRLVRPAPLLRTPA